MKNKPSKQYIFLPAMILLVALLLCSLPVSAISAPSEGSTGNIVARATEIADDILQAQMDSAGVSNIRSWADEVLPDRIAASGEWYAIALRQRDPSIDLSVYRQALQIYLRDRDSASDGAVTRQRYALALLAVGGGDSYLQSVAADTVGAMGLMSYVWGLQLINNALPTSHDSEDILAHLLVEQGQDGGWSLRGPASPSDVDTTAMTLQALAPHRGDPSIREAIERALTYLSLQQGERGDYKSFGVSCPESGAQVIVALTSLGIAVDDPRFVKNGATLLDGILQYRTKNGCFSHTLGGKENQSATVQCFYAMVAIERAADGRGALYQLERPVGFPDLTDPSVALPNEKEPPLRNTKGWICIAAVVLSALACLVLLLCGKRGWKHYVSVLIVCLLCIAAVLLIDIQPADDYYSDLPPKGEITGKVTLTIRFDTVVGERGTEHLGNDGVILPVTAFEIDANDTVFDILTEAAIKYRLRIQNTGATAASSAAVYIRGINDLYEFDYGDLSGWIYFVNGQKMSVGCGEYCLSDGDVIEFHYSRALGEDLK